MRRMIKKSLLNGLSLCLPHNYPEISFMSLICPEVVLKFGYSALPLLLTELTNVELNFSLAFSRMLKRPNEITKVSGIRTPAQ
jgi:hypothetical protein